MTRTLARYPGDKDSALEQALRRFVPPARLAGDALTERAALLEGLHDEVSADQHVTAVRHLEAQTARYAPFPDGISAHLVAALATRGIAQPYTHQADAMAHALAGRHVVVVTPTASGKTLCYNGPVLSTI